MGEGQAPGTYEIAYKVKGTDTKGRLLRVNDVTVKLTLK